MLNVAYYRADLMASASQGDYMKGHDEQLPYTDGSMRSMYHIRDFEVYRLMQVSRGKVNDYFLLALILNQYLSFMKSL